MIFHRRPSWQLSENKTTDESLFWNRRKVLAAMGITGAAGIAAGIGLSGPAAQAQEMPEFMPKPPLDPAYADAGRAITDEAINSTYNNFYEFGSHKNIWRAAQQLKTDPWTIKIDGMVEKPFEIGMEDLLAKMAVQERIYRHRCVEAWSMVVPWIGFPLADLVKMAAPTSGAKYVRFETLEDKKQMPAQGQSWYPWPYVEGVTIEEAMNPLPLMVVGAYGKVLPKQFGAPLRLHLPWKYGFKSIKSIVRISFTDQKPVSFWEGLQADEYGFWANVNPEFGHRRWSQASERVLGGDGERIPTELYNGYGEEVAGLYANMDQSDRTLFY